MGKFSVLNLLNETSKGEPNSFEVQMISVFDIVESKDNFYSTEEINDLADSIEMLGVQQNLLIKYLEDGKYEAIVGHRRRLACIKLVNEGKENFMYVPCVVESSNDPIREKLLLIYTNSTTRELSDYEKVEQARQLKDILVEYKKEHDVPGRVRDLIANTLNVSNTQIARMESISNNLSEDLKKEFKEEKISISAAYELSGMEKEKQNEIYQKSKEQENSSATFNISLKEIKNLKKAENIDEKETVENNSDSNTIEDLTEKAVMEEKIRSAVLKEVCNTICKISSYILEKNRYNMDTIRSLSDHDYSFGCGDDGNGYSKYNVECEKSRYYVEEFDGDGKWMFESGSIEQQIRNFNGREWCLINPKKTLDDLDFTVRAYNCLKRAGIETIESLCNMTEDEVRNIHNFSEKCVIEVKEKLTEIGKNLKQQIDNTEDNSSKAEIIEDYITDEELENMNDAKDEEADEDNPEAYSHNDIDYEKRKLTEYLDTFRKDDSPLGKSYGRRKTKMRLDAIILLDKKVRESPVEKVSTYKQPELPILKNNDQRKEWIENYTSWPVWINQKETGEKYYRYDFENGASFVVRVSLHHKWIAGKYSKEETFGYEKYFILGFHDKYIENKTFYESSTNKSDMIEYLKEIQKKS